jgi:hypothetical protein
VKEKRLAGRQSTNGLVFDLKEEQSSTSRSVGSKHHCLAFRGEGRVAVFTCVPHSIGDGDGDAPLDW